ncbi:MAG: hypothetical protein KF684_03960 [Phycisphaeraceae bacterium]|nr:hypothetical protein [Phycisphaeraceae bacterium]
MIEKRLEDMRLDMFRPIPGACVEEHGKFHLRVREREQIAENLHASFDWLCVPDEGLPDPESGVHDLRADGEDLRFDIAVRAPGEHADGGGVEVEAVGRGDGFVVRGEDDGYQVNGLRGEEQVFGRVSRFDGRCGVVHDAEGVFVRGGGALGRRR